MHSGKEESRGRAWVVVALPLCTMDRTGFMDKVSLSRNPREEYSEEEHGGQRPRPGRFRRQRRRSMEDAATSAISPYSRWPTLLSTEF